MNTGNPSSAVNLTEDGSSLMLPFLQQLTAPISQKYPNITLSPAAGGSGKGISDAISGAVLMGGSDAYLSDAQAQQNASLLNIPIAVSGQAVNYNLQGVSGLKLSGDVLAKIYSGTITRWNDPAIAALNSGVTLPSTAIVPVRRVDSSGDTFIFTSFLSATNSSWNSTTAFGTTVTWPAVSGELTASGNPAMVQTCKSTPGCIAYVGISAESSAQSAGLGEALLQNRAGQFVLPSQAGFTAAAAAASTTIPADLRQPLIHLAGATTYPIVNYEYLMVKATQADAPTALAVRTFLTWAIDPAGGSDPGHLAATQFVALPTNVAPKVQAAIARITP